MSSRSRYGGGSFSREHRRSASPRARTSSQDDRRRRGRSNSRDRASRRDRSRDVRPRESKRSSNSRSRSRSRHGGSDRASVASKDREQQPHDARDVASSRHLRDGRDERERSPGSRRSTSSVAGERLSSRHDRVAAELKASGTSSEQEPHPSTAVPSHQSSIARESEADKTATESSRASKEFNRQPSSSSTPQRNRVRWSQPSPISQKRADSTSPSYALVTDPVQEGKRTARRESWGAYLKSSSDFNRAEMKCVALDADLSVAEFWLEIMTKNLEDVGRRIEAHDWNYQKAKEQGELEA